MSVKKDNIARDLKKIYDHVNDDGSDNKIRAYELSIVANSALLISDALDGIRIALNEAQRQNHQLNIHKQFDGQTTVVINNIAFPNPIKRLKQIFRRKNS